MMLLDTCNQVMKTQSINKGSLNTSVVRVVEIYR